jgi:hypothetical protein
MLTSRINVSSLLVATMSVCACFLLLDSQSFAQQATAINRFLAANFSQEDQSTEHATINVMPLASFVNRILNSEDNQNSAFEFLLEGDRDSEGILYNVVATQTSGDPKLKEMGDEFVAALNSSRLLSFLTEAKHVRLKIGASKTDITASASYEAESAPHARQTAQGYGTLFYAASMSRRDYEQMYKSLKASSNGGEVTMTLSMPRETFCALLSKYLSSN